MDRVVLESCGAAVAVFTVLQRSYLVNGNPCLHSSTHLDTSHSFFLRAIPERQHVCRGRECIYACFTFLWPSFLTPQLPIERGPTSTAHHTIITASTR